MKDEDSSARERMSVAPFFLFFFFKYVQDFDFILNAMGIIDGF